MVVEIEGYGKVEAVATAYTLAVYEQEFGGDLIKELFGRTEIAEGDGDGSVIDFTNENWLVDIKALYAMVRTNYDIKAAAGDAAPNDRPKPFTDWVRSIGRVNMQRISEAVVGEALNGFFHAPDTAASVDGWRLG